MVECIIPTDSLKTKFCIEGNKLLYKYANLKNISHKKLGKYIIASQRFRVYVSLDSIYDQGISNGVKIKRLLKRLKCRAAISRSNISWWNIFS